MRKADILPLSLLAVILAGSIGWYVTTKNNPVHLYDANRNRLAETYEEGACAGEIFWLTNGAGNAARAQQCRDSHAYAIDYDLQAVIPGFCVAVLNQGWQGTVTDCIDIFHTNRLWPTLDGRVSAAFTSKYPWPGDVFGPTVDDPRGRVPTRDGITREN